MISLPGYEIIAPTGNPDNDGRICARHIETDQPVSFRFFPVDWPRWPGSRAIVDVYRMLTSVDSPHVVRIHAVKTLREGNRNGVLLVTDPAPHHPLAERFQNPRNGIKETLELAIQLATAVNDLHRAGFIHQGLTGQTVGTDPESGNLMVVDFAPPEILVRPEIADDRKDRQLAGMPADFLPYISPEQTGRMNRPVDFRTDFYAMGTLIYALLTGGPPFGEGDAKEIIHGHIARDPVPPADLRSDIPPPVSEIVMRLLAKTPESRYQSAFAVGSDLDQCLASLNAGDRIDPDFTPGRQDAPETLIVSDDLYGRQPQFDDLCEQFERVRRGTTAVVMISGNSGTGKTRLAEAFENHVVQNSGYFITGRFEQLQQPLPYAAFIEAFGGMIRQILTESAEQVETWRQHIFSALGANVGVICRVIPELEYIIGTPPEIADLSPAEARNRFNMTFEKFFRVFGSAAHPLVIFIDNMQWADRASLEQMAAFFTRSPAGHILLIGACRDDDTEAARLLPETLDTIRKQGTPVHEMTLGNLARSDIHRLLAASLKHTAADLFPLASTVYEKTGGNPFFVKQFAKDLHAQGLLAYHFNSGCWRWTIDDIKRRPMFHDVVDFISEKIAALPENTRKVLETAACIGNRFDLALLSAVSEKPAIDVAFDLWAAADKGCIGVHSAGFNGLRDLLIRHLPPAPAGIDTDIDAPEKIVFDFPHDRLRRTLYDRVPEAEKRRLHLQIGTLLLENTPDNRLANRILEIVNHLNSGKAQITSPDKRRQAADLNRLAGEQAMQARAYPQALQYFQAGQSLLAADAWQRHYPLMYALVKGRMEAHYLNLDVERAEAISRVLIEHAESDEDRAEIYRLKMIMLASRARHQAALQMGLAGLRLLGIRLPATSGRLTVLKHMAVTRWQLRRHDVDGLLALEPMDDRRRLLAMNILIHLCFSAFLCSPYFAVIASLKVIAYTLKYGNSTASPFGYMVYGASLCAIFKNYTEGRRFGDLALKANEAFGTPALTTKLLLLYGSGISVWCDHVGHGLQCHRQGVKTAMETGDINYAVYHVQSVVIFLLASGAPLDTVAAECSRFYEFVENSGDAGALNYLISVRQFVRALKGETPDACRMNDEKFDEARHRAKMENDAIGIILLRHHLLNLRLRYIMGDAEGAVAAGAAAQKLLHYHLGTLIVPEFYFYFALSMAAAWPRAAKFKKRLYRRRIRRFRDKLDAMARTCPENYRHKHLLVAGELAAISGRSMEAMTLYHRAARSARENEFIHIYAVVNERTGRFYRRLRFDENARTCLMSARDAYRKWGATAKVLSLETRFPEIAGSQLPDKPLATYDPIDFAAIVEALQAISTEIVLANLLNNLMQIVLETAGATMTRFLTISADRMYLEAELRAGDVSATIYSGTPLDSGVAQFTPVLNYVWRTGKLMVIDDAIKHRDFAANHYVRAHQPRSVLCLPVIRQTRLVALLYLENHMAPSVFTPSRVEALQLIASQAAISLENARLYENVIANEKQLREMTRQREEESLRYQAQLRSLSSELSLTEERERRRIATQLHDRIGHALTTAAMRLRLLQSQNAGGDQSAKTVREIHGLIEQSIADTQSLTFELSPPILYDLGLEAALDWLAEQTRNQHGIDVSIIDDMHDKPIAESLRVLLFQATRELIFNVVKHAGASRATISISREDDAVRVVIEDNGGGFDPEQLKSGSGKKGGFGLFSIRERLAHQGGRLEISASPGCGTRITLLSPMKAGDGS